MSSKLPIISYLRSLCRGILVCLPAPLLAGTMPVCPDVTNGTYQYLNGQPTPRFITLTVLAAGGGLSLVLLWNAALRHQVRQRTRTLHTELAERRRIETALRHSENLLRAVSEQAAGITGDAFLHTAVRILAEELDAGYAFISEVADPRTLRLHMRILWRQGRFTEGYEYAIHGTPCEVTLTGEAKFACFDNGVAGRFPLDTWLAENGIESYASIALTSDNGQPLGVLAVMHTTPFVDCERVQNVLRILAGRTRAELERLRAEAELSENQTLLTAIMDNSSTLIFVRGRSSQFLLANKTYADYLNLTPDKVVGKFIHDCFPEESARISRRADEEILRRRQAITSEETLSFPDGPRTLLNARFPLFDAAGEEVYAVGGVSTDITARKQAEIQLRTLSQAVEQSGSTVVITDRNGTIEFVNPMFTRVTGYTSEEAVGQNPRLLKSGLVMEETYRDLWRTIARGEIWSGELHNRKKNGECYWEYATISPVKNKQGEITHYVAVKEDMTRRKGSEEELKRAKESAEAASRSKSEFLANMSHEIRTPMNAILGFTEILGTQLVEPRQQEYIQAILNSGKSLLTLINDILDLSKVEAGKLMLNYHDVRITQVFLEMREIFSRNFQEKGLEFILSLDPAMPEVLHLDESRLRQILLNLVGNALKFTKTGYIKLCLSCEPVDAKHVDLFFSVQDSGMGIPAAEHDLIFGPFEQPHDERRFRYGGTGLGLAISRRLAGMMKGGIEVLSAPAAGSTFFVDLAHVEVLESESALVEAFNPDRVHFAPAKILVVDDMRLNRLLIKSFFKSSQLRFIEAENGRKAVEMAKIIRPDVILMDLKMPVMDGYHATEILKQDLGLRVVPVIAVTASVMKYTELTMGKLCDGFLRKPVSKTELVKMLMQFIPYRFESEAVAEDAPVNDAVSEGLSAEVRACLPELLEKIDKLLPDWENLSEESAINELEDFGAVVMEIAEAYAYLPLQQWGEDLCLQASCFNVVQIPQILRRFPELLRHLRNEAGPAPCTPSSVPASLRRDA